MSTHKHLDEIIQLLTDESDTYISTVKFLHSMMIETKEAGTYNRKDFSAALLVHNCLRNKYKQDFNGELLSWYRRFIGLYDN
ncbi:hypothetical protein pEaSNUABM19_00133 [Erwinia phage pEa_SNUABM_19]|nr:hypothetical protein pEaSNUABM19_00133 [Erwinia phage pEa_SNUABM_19]